MNPGNFFWVFIGGGLGSLVRYGISLLFAGSVSSYPWATFWANLAASFILGLLLGLNAQQFLSGPTRLLLMTGFCGGFSTFSTFSGENLQLLTEGNTFILLSTSSPDISIGMLCIYLGLRTGQLFGNCTTASYEPKVQIYLLEKHHLSGLPDQWSSVLFSSIFHELQLKVN